MRYPINVALAEVPVNDFPLLDDTDFKTRETAVAYNAAGMDLVWNFVGVDGSMTQTAVTPTTGGVYDWTHQGDAIYSIEIPKSGGASINNNQIGKGWFSGVATGVLPFKSPIYEFVLGGEITGGTPTPTSFLCADLIGIGTDQVADAFVVMISGAALYAVKKITAFNNTTGAFTVNALPATPSVGDRFYILNGA
mgnify:FL=1